ncbi:MAG TPA: type I glutamate--ammonia ligase [Candidatus Thermoplasmatota archaeon]|nr:type I glutamate--ammonia ligase [Candidatus Thermoplasmatota archaeon]
MATLKKTTWTAAEVVESAKAENVRFLHLMFSDIKGIPKNVALPIERLEEVMESGVQFDGSSIAGFAEIQESDMILKPDPNTWAVLPWTSGSSKSARLICDVYKPDGTRYEGDPRYVLQKAMKKAAELGYTCYTGPECEFYLFKKDERGNPTAVPHDTGAYFDVGFSDHGEACRNEITIYLEQMGFNIEASHHEVGPGQHEIDFNYGDALTSADRILTLKWVTKIVAQKHGLHATFMPKPMYKQAGSGMHVHQSLWKDGKNAFYDPNGKFQLSKTAYSYMAGLLKYTPEITAVLNSTVNSYKRLVPGYEAPCYIAWANKNRSALIRVPAARGKGTRLELRCPDPAGNPYLQTAVMLAAGMEGVKNKLTPPDPVEQDIYHMTPAERKKNGVGSLPGSLREALDKFENSKIVRDVLGEHIFDQFVHVKNKEWDEFRLRVHPWELAKYLPKT